MKHWTNTLIRDKIYACCEENGVHFLLQSSTYRSQRCSSCGLVRKANRKGKEYICSNCGLIIDSDYNASLNHEQELPDIPFDLRKQRKNLGKGFFWKPEGFFDIYGKELTVPFCEKVKVENNNFL